MGLWMLGWMLGQGGGEPPIAPWRMVEMHSLSSAAVPDGPRVFVDTRGVWVDGVQVVEGPLTPGSDLSGLDGLKQASVSASGALPVGLLQPVMERLGGADLLVEGPSGEAVTPWRVHGAGALGLAVQSDQVVVLRNGAPVGRYLCPGHCAAPGGLQALGDYLAVAWPSEAAIELVVAPAQGVAGVVAWEERMPTSVVDALGVRVRGPQDPRLSARAVAEQQLRLAQQGIAELPPCPGELEEVLVELASSGELTRLTGGRSAQGRCVDRALASISLRALSSPGEPVVFAARVGDASAPIQRQPGVPSTYARSGPGYAVLEGGAEEDLYTLNLRAAAYVEQERQRGFFDLEGHWIYFAAKDPQDKGPGLRRVSVHVDRLGFRVGPSDEVLEVLYCSRPCVADAFPVKALAQALEEMGAEQVDWNWKRAPGVPVQVWRQAHAAAVSVGVWEHRLVPALAVSGELGSLDKRSIDVVVRRNLSGIQRCYRQDLEAGLDLHGELVVTFVIAADGDVQSSEVKSSEYGDAPMNACVLRIMDGLQFAAPGGQVRVSYPFVFEPEG